MKKGTRCPGGGRVPPPTRTPLRHRSRGARRGPPCGTPGTPCRSSAPGRPAEGGGGRGVPTKGRLETHGRGEGRGALDRRGDRGTTLSDTEREGVGGPLPSVSVWSPRGNACGAPRAPPCSPRCAGTGASARGRRERGSRPLDHRPLRWGGGIMRNKTGWKHFGLGQPLRGLR